MRHPSVQCSRSDVKHMCEQRIFISGKWKPGLSVHKQVYDVHQWDIQIRQHCFTKRYVHHNTVCIFARNLTLKFSVVSDP